MTVDTTAAVAGLPDASAAALKAGLDEIVAIAEGGTRGVKQQVVAGAAAVTNIALAGVKTTDRIIGVVGFPKVADTGTSATGNKLSDCVDLTAEASITSTGNIQLATTNTTTYVLVVTWLDLTT